MIMTYPTNFLTKKYPWLISLGIHIGILLMLSLISLTPKLPEVWHSFDWEQLYSVPVPRSQSDAAPNKEAVETGVRPRESTEPSKTLDAAPSVTHTPSEGESELIEMPKFNPVNTSSQRPNVNKPGLSNLQNLPVGDRDGIGSKPGGFGSDLEGDDLQILYRAIPTVEAKVYGVITMSFRISQEGRVLPETIRVISYTTSEYLQPSISALEKWRFNTIGRYHKERVYKITFRYNPE